MSLLLRVAVSIRTTVVLMLLVATMLLLTVIVPQRAVVGSAAADRAASTALGSFLVDTLGLGSIGSSPVFLAVLALFYVNLVAVMLDRLPRTLAKLRAQAPTAEALQKWIASPRAIEGTAEAPVAAAAVVAMLRAFGYRPSGVSGTSMYAVKGRTAALGFLVFHVSFLFLCAGGLAIWYTRFVGELRVVEGQRAEVRNARIVRSAPAGEVPPMGFTLEKMAPAFERGEATDLRATLRFDDGPAVEAWVNHPARQGPVSLLVTDVGTAPVFWLQDAAGFGLDRVAVPADRSAPVDVPLAGGVVVVRVLPREGGAPFPLRAGLQTLPFDLVVTEGNHESFRGALRPGEAAALRGGRLVLTEVRYWGGVRVIRERGGAVLIAGFLLATIGATWRLLMRRRELVIAWSGNSFRVAGHGEWFTDRDRRELMALAAALERSGAPVTNGEKEKV